MAARSPRPRSRWWIPVTVVVAAAALVLAILVIDRGDVDEADESVAQDSDTAGAQEHSAATDVEHPEHAAFTEAETRDEDDVQAIGPVDAPVVLVVFSDYQCPYCASWSADTLPSMMDYADTGDLRIEWRDVNVFGDASEQAAKAAHAAGRQGSFWEFHDELFTGGEHRSPDDLTAEALTDTAEGMGLDTAQFDEDLESDETQEAIDEYAQMGVELGAFSTPAFLVGGEPIVGAQPTDVFTEAVDTALAAQS
ncbi:DsbA family protein [Brevibacterium jeotgali]|uniref:Protein-disulfide isomerase n=1 Tax=Brevibacterium jeotgali TaxID=1262550 RepID=A0A2H1L5I5_9MICO|nr:thioredoxin domain-containing protein [Brevibacterium jeotgali]TWB98757.1 protein-disulfide isomerase [Brevibacterium jeotgali]SMY11643.1 Protein-disulfide isomerase [Brevibacterium jeotgali]